MNVHEVLGIVQYRRAVTAHTDCERCGSTIGLPCVQKFDCLNRNHDLPVPHEHEKPMTDVHDERCMAYELWVDKMRALGHS